MIKRSEIKLKHTCHACPDQYDVYNKDTKVGYIRFRWGHLRCNPVVNNEYLMNIVLYEWNATDGMLGIIPEHKRPELLNNCINALIKYHNFTKNGIN